MKKIVVACSLLAGLLTSHCPADTSGLQTLRDLMAGNQRFVEGAVAHQHESAGWRKRLSSAQHPQAVILGCADSRVPPELVFDEGFGDLFVVRVAGHVLDVDSAASVEYGVMHTGCKLVLILGHEGCGAVTAALEDYTQEPLPIQFLLKQIVPALQALPEGPPEARLDAAVRANVRQAVREARSMKPLTDQGVLIVGAVYNLHSGRVELLDPPAGL